MKTLVLVLFALLILPQLTAQANAETCGVFQKKIDDKCVHFDVPSNAHLTYSGNSWDCNRGFERSAEGNFCNEINIPDNASGNLIGGFNCNSGYKKEGDVCVRVKEVENGKFYETGADFYCLNGYTRNKDLKTCVKVSIPAYAREDSSSLDGWRCFSGYVKEGSECKEFKLPDHAYWFIDFWGCEPGYRKNSDNKSCDKIALPENARPANTFDGWLCNDGYIKNYKENRCDKTI